MDLDLILNMNFELLHIDTRQRQQQQQQSATPHHQSSYRESSPQRQALTSAQSFPYPTTSSTPPRSAFKAEYKSPFERKREKEIKKLTRKVTTLKEERNNQEQQLSALRMSTAFAELSSMEYIIR